MRKRKINVRKHKRRLKSGKATIVQSHLRKINTTSPLKAPISINKSLINNIRDDLKNELTINNPLLNKFYVLEGESFDLYEKIESLRKECIERKEQEFLDKMPLGTFSEEETDDIWFQFYEECGKQPSIALLRKRKDAIYLEINKIMDEIGNQILTKDIIIDDITIHISAAIQYNGDTVSFLYEEWSDIDIGNRTYWWKNAFDAGDIAGKNGCPAFWYVKENLDKVDPICIPDEIDNENMIKISKLLDIGIRLSSPKQMDLGSFGIPKKEEKETKQESFLETFKDTHEVEDISLKTFKTGQKQKGILPYANINERAMDLGLSAKEQEKFKKLNEF